MNRKRTASDLFEKSADIFNQEKDENNLELLAKYQEYYGSRQLQENYVLRGSILKCSMGSALSRLDMPSDHGMEPTIALMSDCVITSNIHSFGTCSCRANSCDSKCQPSLNRSWIQGGVAAVKIWNELTQKYEDGVKDSAVLPCFRGGMITIVEVPPIESSQEANLLLCIYGNKFAIVDTSHPLAETVLRESVILIDIEDMEISERENSSKTFSTHGSNLVQLTSKTEEQSEKDTFITRIDKGNGVKEKVREEEDSVEQQEIAAGYIFDNVDEIRGTPDPDSLTGLAEAYLKAGGDQAGIGIGLVWALGISPNAPKQVSESLRQKGVIGEGEKIGEITVGAEEIDLLRFLLTGYINEGTIANNIMWKEYMQANPILKGKVGDVVIPMGHNLEKGKRREIKNMQISMIIENGAGYTGYEFLHGTDMNVGGFQIEGRVSKNKSGDVTYDLTYIWNDIINPEVERYIDDRDRNNTANAYFNPKNYIIRIKWNDKTIIKEKPGFWSSHTGWLKDWSGNWENELTGAYGERYSRSEREQIRMGALAWADRLCQIKNEYVDYYD